VPLKQQGDFMGRKDTKIVEKVALEVLIRNDFASGGNAIINDVGDPGGDFPADCDRVCASQSVRSFTCDFQLVG
jgi:hypothetical protein